MIAAAGVFGEEETVFRRLLSSIGVGGARVDTRLGAESFVPGGPVSGEVYITGGDAQGFNRICLSVVNYKHEDSTHEHTLAHYDVVLRRGGERTSAESR